MISLDTSLMAEYETEFGEFEKYHKLLNFNNFNQVGTSLYYNILLYCFSYLVCKTNYCKGSAKILADGKIETITDHTHDPNEASFQLKEIKKKFRSILVERSKKETKRLRLIYDEESVKYEYYFYSLELSYIRFQNTINLFVTITCLMHT